jgi:hypothetical protein
MGVFFLHKNKTLSIIELHLNYAIMNEFNSQPKSGTQIGEPKILPTISEQTILQQPEQLIGNENVETGHELTNPSEMQTATATIEEVREVVQEIPIVESPQAPAVESMQVDQVADVTVTDTTVIPEKKKMNIFVKAAIIGSAAAGTVLGGLGLSGGFSGKKSEMGKMQEGPKTEQTTSIFDVGKVNPDGSVVTAIANEPSIYNAPKPDENETKSRMDGAVMPAEPTMEKSNDEAEIQRLMRESSMSRERAEATYARIKEVNNTPEAKEQQAEAQRLAEIKERNRKVFGTPAGHDQAALDRAQAQARAMESERSGVQVRDAVGEEVQMIESLYGMGNKLENTELAGIMQRPLPGAKLRIFFNFEKGQNFQNMKNIRIDQLRQMRNGSLDVETKGLIQGMSQQEFDKTIKEIQNAPIQDINQSEYSISMKTNNGPRRINFGGKTKGVIEIDLNTDINAVGYWRNGSPEFTKEFVH